MKDSAEHGLRLKKLCNRLKRSGGKVTIPSPNDPITELVLGCLSSHTTENKARTALNAIRNHFVDFNELRVGRADEVVELLGKGFPQAKAASKQILQLLNTIFARENCLELSELSDGGKRDAKLLLEQLDGADAYVVARVMLRSLEAHAFPVHEQLMNMLEGEEVIEPNVDVADVQGFLERHISVNDVQKTYALLRRHADRYRPNKKKSSDESAKKVAVKKKTAGGTARKTASKKTARSTKKTAKR